MINIKFEKNQSYQLEAIDAVVSLFRGLPKPNYLDSNSFSNEVDSEKGELFHEIVFPNRFNILRDDLISNISKVQARTRSSQGGHQISVIPKEQRIPIAPDAWPSDFSIEMETGTGKTYVYLRTIFELYLKYGLSKFVIVVPSIAIREGVLSTLRLTNAHFNEIYSGVQFDSFVYDSKNINRLRQFATSSHLQILIMNIASFNRDENIIKKEMDSLNGLAPIDFIRSVAPVVIMDEPQKLGSELATKAIEELKPIFRLRYSATHKDFHNLVYKLSPMDAYQMRLVKQIDVLSVSADEDRNSAYVEVKGISASTAGVTATLIVNKGTKRTQVTVRRNTDLFLETKLSIYEGWVVEDIHAGNDEVAPYVVFANGRILRKGSSTGVDLDMWQRNQIRATIDEHFNTELRLQQLASLGVIARTKPLTLFFIDRVMHYASDDAKFRKWFEEEYEGVASMSKYRNLSMPNSRSVHRGYFASTKLGPKDSKEGKGNKEDEEAFDLIMRSKERLLSLEEPVRFIFSHSALAEGWDNPNVFTICNLQDTHSEIRRRQQIGRGLRLPVMENGERCRVEEVNHLTVIATETFENFATGLQKELKEDTGFEFTDLIRDKRKRISLVPKDDYQNIPGFRELWEKISHRTSYNLDFSTENLIEKAVKRLLSFETISVPQVRITKQNIGEISGEKGIVGGPAQTRSSRLIATNRSFPDVLKDITEDLPISRSTAYQVIIDSGRLKEAVNNPALFVSQVRQSLFGALAATLKDHDGIRYEKLASGSESVWNARFFIERIAESYEDNLLEVQKSIFEKIPVDSIIERNFAKGLDARDDVDLFIKLPSWFKIDTPVGGYNPDWAIVRREGNSERKLYLVRETKGSTNLDDLFRESEVWKVTFGRKHFDAIEVDYKVVKESEDLDKDVTPILELSVWESALK